MASKRLQRPHDPIQLGKLMVDIAPGQAVDALEDCKDQAARTLSQCPVEPGWTVTGAGNAGGKPIVHLTLRWNVQPRRQPAPQSRGRIPLLLEVVNSLCGRWAAPLSQGSADPPP